METLGVLDLSAWAVSWSEGLWRASWQGALCALLAWALTRWWPRMPASLRAGLWWLVALKFVVALGGPRPLELPLLPASRESVRAAPVVADAPRGLDAPVVAQAGEGAAERPGAVTWLEPEAQQETGLMARLTSPPRGTWLGGLVLGLLGVWMAGVLWRAREHVRGFLHVRSLRRQATRLTHPVLEAELRELAEAAGLRRVPGLLVSDAAPSPLATGLLSPVVVLPTKAVRRLPVEGLRMALAHEVAHLRRGDLWLGWVPALAEALLFFHPLARRVAREYALAREEACDAEALRLTGAEAADYGELLLVFGVTRPHGTAAALGASNHVQVLHRRLSMLEHVEVVSPPSRRWLKVALSTLGLAALVPFQVVARPSDETPKDATVSASPKPAVPKPSSALPTKPAPSAPGAPAQGMVIVTPGGRPPPPAPPRPPPPVVAMATTPTAPVPPRPPSGGVAAPVPPRPPAVSDDDFGYVLMVDANTATMSGSTTDLELARMFRKKGGPPLLFARVNGDAFIIRDETTLKAVRGTLEPLRATGEEQGRLGDRMGTLGEQQGELGQRQAELGQKQAELGIRQAELGHERAGLSLERMRLNSLSEEERDRREEELDKRDDALEAQLDALGEQQEKLGAQQEALGEEQEKLGEQQQAMGREQQKLGEQQEKRHREAHKKVRAIIEEALGKGLGQPLPT
ncbi:peptidase M56 [Myxococcus sp. K15C18031901]|uniref:M56 family metallopeptidase n=1 Tax=Myxococcus dinghuensis TaxID=2906761 RepID=UPI0020A7EE46|nr:M56 family metallopeptidase [Myxococcus dinghuensis]MCP3099839.1 peptidase M56 [Myxococcus dinghuensis]